MKLIIIDSEGRSLRSLPSCRFNSDGRAVGKKVVNWTFSARGVDLEKGIYSDTILKALKKLEEAGFKNLRVVPLNDEIEEQLEEVNYKAGLSKGKAQPRNDAEALEIVRQVCPEELEADTLHPDVYPKCLACSRACKQNRARVTLWDCPQYDMKANS